MLTINIERLLNLRGAKHHLAYLKKYGLTEAEARTVLKGKGKMIKLRILTRLCEIFKCTPNDLLDWNGSDEHVLASLKKSAAPDIQKLLATKTPKELEEMMREMRGNEK